MIKLPKTGCKTFKVLQCIGSQQGIRYGEIVRFICAINGKNYDAMEPGYSRKTRAGLPMMVRRHRGEWATNLNARRDGILAKYCVKGADKKWYLRADTAQALGNELLNYVGTKVIAVYYIGGYKMFRDNTTSALNAPLPSDEIVNNSKVVSREVYRTGVTIEPAPTKICETELEAAIRGRKELRAKLVRANELHEEALQTVERAKALALKTAGEAVVISREIEATGYRILKLLDEVK